MLFWMWSMQESMFYLEWSKKKKNNEIKDDKEEKADKEEKEEKERKKRKKKKKKKNMDIENYHFLRSSFHLHCFLFVFPFGTFAPVSQPGHIEGYGGWRVESGEWRVESGEWRVEVVE
jgi:hypothetical protein